jgi:hypothetical protein
VEDTVNLKVWEDTGDLKVWADMAKILVEWEVTDSLRKET